MEINYEDLIYGDSMCPSVSSDYQNDLSEDDDNSDEKNEVVPNISALTLRESPLKKQPAQQEQSFNLKKSHQNELKPASCFGKGPLLRRKKLRKLKGSRKKDTLIHKQNEEKGDEDLDDDTLTMADFLEENCYYLCLGASITNPGYFYVNLCQSWNYLERLMEKMQNFYKRVAEDPKDDSEASVEYLIPGAVVAVKCRAEREWHRGKIVEIDNSGAELLYDVKLLDYGEIEKVSAKAIRHLMMPHWIELTPQRILCRAELGGFYTLDVQGKGFIKGLGKESWTFYAADAFKQEIFNKPMLIHTKNKMQIEGETAWEVFIHLYDEEQQQITKFHLERGILEKSRGIYFQLDTDETDSDAQPPKAIVQQIKPSFQNATPALRPLA